MINHLQNILNHNVSMKLRERARDFDMELLKALNKREGVGRKIIIHYFNCRDIVSNTIIKLTSPPILGIPVNF